jgi:hypothetical protein
LPGDEIRISVHDAVCVATMIAEKIKILEYIFFIYIVVSDGMTCN